MVVFQRLIDIYVEIVLMGPGLLGRKRQILSVVADQAAARPVRAVAAVTAGTGFKTFFSDNGTDVRRAVMNSGENMAAYALGFTPAAMAFSQ